MTDLNLPVVVQEQSDTRSSRSSDASNASNFVGSSASAVSEGMTWTTGAVSEEMSTRLTYANSSCSSIPPPEQAQSVPEDDTEKQSFGITWMTVLSVEASSTPPQAHTEDLSAGAILTAEDQRAHESEWTSPKSWMILQSRWPLIRRFYYTGVLTTISIVVTSWTIYYAYNASVTSDPFVSLLWVSSNSTIFTINLMAQITLMFLTELVQIVSECFRWSRACTPQKGIPLLSFLALSRSISPVALLSLATPCIPDWRMRLKDHRFQWLAIQRFPNPL